MNPVQAHITLEGKEKELQNQSPQCPLLCTALTRAAHNLQHLPVSPVQEVNKHQSPWERWPTKKINPSSFSHILCSPGPQNDPASLNWTSSWPPNPPPPAELRATCLLQMKSLPMGVPKSAASSRSVLLFSENHLAQAWKESPSPCPLQVIGCNLLEWKAQGENAILLRLLSPLELNLRKVNNWHKRGFWKAGLYTHLLWISGKCITPSSLSSKLHHHLMGRERLKK